MVAIIFETSCQSLPRPRSIEARQQIPPIHASSLGNGSYEYTPYAPVPLTNQYVQQSLLCLYRITGCIGSRAIGPIYVCVYRL